LVRGVRPWHGGGLPSQAELAARRDLGSSFLAYQPAGRCFIDGRSLRISAALLSLLMAIAPSLAAAQSAPAGVTNIIPDGRTATTVTTNGSVSTVTTGTISGPNAFNSFSQFQIGAGNTGNLILPGGTSNLINLINGNNPAVINGVMNSYKNGQIGGNVYFAAPGGFIVGRSGVVNVGSLNVTTPTREFVDGMISPSGQINQGAVNNLLAGTVPISPDGNIRIRGRVNAVEAVRLTGQNVFVGNARDVINRDHAVKFASTVNSKGLRSSNGIVVRNGSIQIVANDSAKINGRLAARKDGGKGGDIVVLASGAIRIGGAAALNARGKTGDAGNIIVKAGTNLTVDSGARFNAGSAAGGAGVVELSSFGTFNLAQGFKVDIGGANGKNGVLLIDPNDVVIGDAALDTGVNMSNADVANSIAAIAGGGTWALSGDSITVAANGVIDGRKLGTNGKSNADSVSIELDAPVISVFGKILANAENDATSTFLAGDVRLNAVQSVNLIAGLAEATTLIEVGGNALIKGKNIALNSNATAISSYLDSAAGIAALIGQSAAASAIGLNGGYVAGTSSATITIRDTATIDGTGNVDIASSARQVASDPAVTIGGASPVAVAVTVGEISGTVNTTVGTGTHVYAGGNLNITGQNDAQLNVIAIGMSSDAQAAATVAYGTASVNTTTVVQTGADLKVGGNLYVGARNINSFNVSATSYALGQTGKAGVAIAYSDVGTTATATLGANVGASGTPIPGSVTVEANSGMPNSSQDATNTTSSTAAAGNPILIDLVAKGAASFTQKKFTDFVAVKAPASSRTDLKFAGALSLAFSDQAAKASIAATSPASAPSINAAGNVAVVAKVSDVGVSSLADASTNSQEIADPNASSTQSQAKTAVALGVAIGNYGHHANAFIGQGVSVCCASLGVSATVEMPITINWLTYDSLGTWLAKFNGNLGTVNQVLTSYANAASQAQDATRVGAANYFAVDNSATAWVGEGATITRNSATPAAPWSTVLADGTSLAWDQAIAVQAATRTASIDVGGNFSWLGLTGNSGQQNEAGHSQGEAIGGAVNIVSYKNRTIAGISDGVTVTSNGEVGVSAKNENVIFAVSPTSGAGNADSYNGIAAVALIDDVAHASISNSARITAPAVDINADEVLSIFSVGGAVASSESTAVGLVVAINQIVADTAAYIGDNRTDITDSRDAANDPGTTSSVAGYVHADDLQIDAQSYGVVTAATVAATKASNNGSSGSTFFTKFVSLLSKSDDASGGAAAKSNSKSGTTTPTFGLALSGSTSINISEVNTSAYVSGAVIDKNSATVAASVQAVNNTIMAAGAGSAALDMAKKQGDKSAAIAGAVAINISGNATRAYADNSIISDARSFSALALSGGEQTSVGIGLAINQSADKDKAASAAGSVSIAVVTDLVDAHVSGSTITVDPALISSTLAYTDAFIVAAYQTTDIGVGGGSLYFGGKTGFGFALTYTKIGDPSGLKAVNAHVTDSTVTGFFNATVSASYASRVGAGAGLFGYQKGNGGTGVGFGVSLVITEISPTVNASIDGGSVVEVAGLSQMSPVVYASTVVSTTQLTDTADTDYTETGRFVNPLDPGTTYYAYNVAHTVMELRRGDVAVSSNGTRIGAFDSAIASAARTGGDLVNTGLVDFSGAAIAAEGTNSGASITAVAGLIQGGANSVGFAITASTINQSNIATIDHARVVSDNGDVVVTADSSADILGVAVGIAVSDGKFAGLASSSINLINNTVSAAVGGSSATPSNTVVEGANLVVRATDNADIRGAAGTLGIGLGSAAAGLSVTYDQIGNSVTAAISGAKVAVDNDVLLNAASNSDILSIAIGIAVSKNVGIAGSVVTNISDTNVTARIDSGADVTASNNVGVIADNTDTMKVVAGALGVGLTSAGVGISVVVNDVKGATTATIAGAATKVDAYAVGGSALSVNSGTPAQSFDVSTADNPNLDIPDLSETQRSVSGVAVVASSHQAVVGVDVTIGLSAELLTGDALALAPVTSLMGGSTTASIDGAQVGTRLANSPSASIAPEIFVGAGSLSYSRNLVIAGSGAGGFSGAGAIAANRMERATHAFIQDATIGTSTRAVGNVAINAAATQIASDIAVGLAVGVAGAGASIIVNVFSADTQAYLTHGALYASNLAVNALSTEGYFAAGGAAAVNFLGGFAGAFVVGVSQNTTKAYIGDTDDDTSVTLANDLAVNARSDNTFYSYAIGGSAAGTGAVAGMVDFTVVNNHTEATMTNVTDTQTAAGSDVTVSALETVVIRPTAGAGAVGLSGAGIGASINVVLLKSQVASGIVDSAVDTKGAVNVTATSNKDIDMQTVTFGAGGSVGIAASISLLLAGQTAPGDATDQISASVSTIDSATNSVPADNGIASDDVPGSGNPPADRPPSYSLANALGSANDAVTAEITGGSTKAGSVKAEATASVKTKNTASGVGLGGTVGVGAALGYSLVYDTVAASIEGDVTSDKVDVLATMQDNSGHAVEVNAYAGAGALGAAVGAAVAVGTINNTVAARLAGKVTGSGVGTAANKATASALDTSSVSTQSVGAAIAAGALGISVANSTKSSLVYATVPEGAVIGGYSGVAVRAEGRGRVVSDATAGAGGVIAGSGAGANSVDNENIIAEVGTSKVREALDDPATPTAAAPSITVGLDGLEVRATGAPEAAAKALGISVGAAGVGASVALATVNPSITAFVDSSASIITAPVSSADTPPVVGFGALSVIAEAKLPSSGRSADAWSVAGTGGYLIGANATDSEATNNSHVYAGIGNNVLLPLGNVSVKAINTTSQTALTTGVSVGYIALGVAVALTTADTSTVAEIGTSVTTADMRPGNLTVSAVGSDTVDAEAVSGVGGVVAGNGAGSNTTVNSNVAVKIGNDSDIDAGLVSLIAAHTTTYKAKVSTVNASLAGASGAAAVNKLDSNVNVDIGKNVQLTGLSNACGTSACLAGVTLVAENDFVQGGSGDSATGAGGGVLNGAAVEGNTKITGHAAITIADADDLAHRTVILAGTDPFGNPGGIRMTAFSTFNATDTVSLETGGAITSAGANTTVNAELKNDVTVGNFAELTTFGSIGLGTFTQMSVDTGA
jgi:filamentous hemagglutinin family protein